MLKPDRNNDSKNGPTKVLNAPIHLGSMAANLESSVSDIKSIWVMQRDDTLVSYLQCLKYQHILTSFVFKESWCEETRKSTGKTARKTREEVERHCKTASRSKSRNSYSFTGTNVLQVSVSILLCLKRTL